MYIFLIIINHINTILYTSLYDIDFLGLTCNDSYERIYYDDAIPNVILYDSK